jgi:hypothetical protein
VNTATITRAEMVRQAHAALHMAGGVGLPRDKADRELLFSAVVILGDALEAYAGLDSRALHWEVACPHLRDEAGPEDEAARKAAEEVASAAEDLIKVMAAKCGTEDETTIPGVGK